LAACSNEQSKLEHPVKYSGIPRETIKVQTSRNGGDFVVGYRIITDEYIIISGINALFEQEGQVISSPSMGLCAALSTFGCIVKLAEKVKDKSPITFYGDIVYPANANQPYLFEGKKVIILFSAKYNYQHYAVDRRLWDD